MPSSIHIDASRQWGGGQTQSLGLARALAALGESASFIAQQGSALSARLRTCDLPWEERPLRGLSGAAAVFHLAHRFRKLKPEIVHIHDAAGHGPAALAAKRAGVPGIVVTRRTASLPRTGWPRGLKYQWCDRIICISEAVRRQCLAAGIAPERLAVIHDFVDCTYLDPAVGRAFLRPPLPSVLCVVGRLSKEKGHEVLLRALPSVLRQVPFARLQVCGEGPKKEALQRQAEALGISEQVALLGFVEDVRPVLAAAEVFAMPSLSEGLGVAVLEAMAMGKPVVATDAGGLPEAVVDGETGLIVPPGDAGALTEAILSLLQNPDKARHMGAAGRERALRQFDRSVIVERMLALYNEVLSEARR